MTLLQSTSGGEVRPSRTIPFHRVSIDESEIAAVTACLRSGWLTTGPRVQEFEQAFADYIGVAYALAVNSCTAAMHLALAALDIGPGDEVITTPYTFVATCEAIQYLGASPVFVDIDPHSGNIAISQIESAITARTRAILPVHLAGYPCDLPALRALAAAHHLHLVDDAAHALESAFSPTANQPVNGSNSTPANWSSDAPFIKVGTNTDATCFSFYATKNITTGEGGMITCSDASLTERIRRLSLHGMSRDAWKRYSGAGSWYYEIIEQGYKDNMTDIAAALGLVQLQKVQRLWARRREIARRYSEAFAVLPELEPAPVPEAGIHAWHLYLLRLNLANLHIDRATFIERLKGRGVQCSVHFIPLHLMPYYRQQRGFRGDEFPHAVDFYRRVVSLPIYPAMSDDDVTYVIDMVQKTLDEQRPTWPQPAVADKVQFSHYPQARERKKDETPA